MLEIITRDEYLDYRQFWKEEYVNLSRQIRALKQATRLASRMGYAAAQAAGGLEKEMKEYMANSSALQSMRAHKSNYAHTMMDDLDDWKERCRLSVLFEKFKRQQNENL